MQLWPLPGPLPCTYVSIAVFAKMLVFTFAFEIGIGFCGPPGYRRVDRVDHLIVRPDRAREIALPVLIDLRDRRADVGDLTHVHRRVRTRPRNVAVGWRRRDVVRRRRPAISIRRVRFGQRRRLGVAGRRVHVVDLFERRPEPRRGRRRRQPQHVQADQPEQRRPLARHTILLQKISGLRVVARDDCFVFDGIEHPPRRLHLQRAELRRRRQRRRESWPGPARQRRKGFCAWPRPGLASRRCSSRSAGCRCIRTGRSECRT